MVIKDLVKHLVIKKLGQQPEQEKQSEDLCFLCVDTMLSTLALGLTVLISNSDCTQNVLPRGDTKHEDHSLAMLFKSDPRLKSAVSCTGKHDNKWDQIIQS